MTTCVVAFKESPGFFDIDLVATTVSRPRESIFLSLSFQGFKMKSAMDLTRRFIENLSWEGAR
jgi:hypothetical protein